MSIYDNETIKIHPDLNLTALLRQEVNPQNYILEKISEIKPIF